MTRGIALTLCLLALAGPTGRAQQLEIVPLAMAGISSPTDLEQQAPELDELRIRRGFTWGGQVGYFFSTHWGIEALFTRQDTALQVTTAAGHADLFTMHAAKLHGNAVYQFGSDANRLRPFLFAGLGSTFFGARYLESETKLSATLGGGIKYFPAPRFGIRLHASYTPTMLDDESAGEFCDPFGFCQGTLQQFELITGFVVRF